MNRIYGSLKAPEIPSRLSEASILCLPLGSYEQHGPHLPLNTDTILAERFTERLIARYGDQYDLWALPSIPYGLALEHAWSPGTISLPVGLLTSLLSTIVAEYTRATPAHRLLIVNGHGGNRGILEAVIYELQTTHDVGICVVHPSSLSKVKTYSVLPEIHAGKRETSVMLALAPGDVYLEGLPDSFSVNENQRKEIERLVLNRGTTWPWTSDDSSISNIGIIGDDPRLASAELGEFIVARALDACEAVLKQIQDLDGTSNYAP